MPRWALKGGGLLIRELNELQPVLILKPEGVGETQLWQKESIIDVPKRAL